MFACFWCSAFRRAQYRTICTYMKFMRISFITMYDLLLIFFATSFLVFLDIFCQVYGFYLFDFFFVIKQLATAKTFKTFTYTSFTSKLWNSSKIVDKMQSNIFFFSFFIYQFYSESPTLWDRSIYIIYWSN